MRNVAVADDGRPSSFSDGQAGTKATVLVVEDDANLIRTLAVALEVEGYEVIDATSGRRAVEEVRTRNPDIVLLDLGLPDVDGIALVAEIRRHTAAPIIVVSGDDRESDKVRALDVGADDYMTKPFSPSELWARIRVGLRNRAHVTRSATARVTFGPYTLDLQGRRLMRSGVPVRLSRTEFKLLVALARRADQVVTTDTLLKEAWGVAYQRRSEYVRVYMHALRKKIEADPANPKFILNDAGLGYRLQTAA